MYEKLRIVSTEFTQKRQEEIRNCNHLFVNLRQGEEIFGCHSTDYYKRKYNKESCAFISKLSIKYCTSKNDTIFEGKKFKNIVGRIQSIKENILGTAFVEPRIFL